MSSPAPNASPSDANPPTTSSSNSTNNATNDNSPPPQSSSLSPPPAAPPPLASSSPPPPIVPASPPLNVASSPPPSVASPPPPNVASPPPPKSPPSPPPSDANASPPAASPPPPTPITTNSPPPAAASSPPPPNVSPPPPPKASPTPPSDASPLPASSPPPPPPPPPVDASPPASDSPPPPKAPAKSPPAPIVTPPPSAPSPAVDTPPESTSPPRSAPTKSSPPAVSPPAPVGNSSTDSSPAPSGLPTAVTTQKPTVESTSDASVIASGAPSKGLSTGGAVVIGVVVGVLVLSLVVMAVWFAKKKKRKGGAALYTMPSPFASSQNSDSVFLRPHSPSPFAGNGSGKEFMYAQSESGASNSRSCFTYEEMVQATNGFSKKNLLGEGGFGCVYKGILEDGREVAVKQLKIGGSQGEREFRAEVEIISRVHHRHLVSLVGYCISDHQRLLVYDFVLNDTLYYHLHGQDMPVMDWATRVKIAAGAARGIAYLHEDCHPRIIHRDIKSSNILLDGNFKAQVADFGLAKLALDTNTHVSTRVMGTFGYMAPEYATSGKLTDKSDVYSYGVVLLELITGRKHVDDSQPLGDESLVEWARPLLTDAVETGDLSELADPRLEKNYVESEMFRLIEAASACVRHSAAKRPRMRQVVRALVSLDDTSDLSNGMTPGHSEIYNSADHSAQIRRFQKMAFASQEYSTSYFNQTQSSLKSSNNGDQSRGSWNIDLQREQNREHGNQSRSTWSRDERNKDTVISIDRSGEWNL